MINYTKSKLYTRITLFEEVIKKVDGGVREDFEHVNRIINEIDFPTLKPIIQFAYSINKSFFDNQYNITEQQKILYGLD